MIVFKNISPEKPYEILKSKYDDAINAKQQNVEAICISSYSTDLNEVNARFVNLKFVDDKNFIFFSNYESPKSKEFDSHNQISALLYWSSIDVQIRMKANIKKTQSIYNNEYFSKRDIKKNALAISSMQSQKIDSYESVQNKYNNAVNNNDLSHCPEYWGGYTFVPYYFEFWQGHKSRLNRREVYESNDGDWDHYFLQP